MLFGSFEFRSPDSIGGELADQAKRQRGLFLLNRLRQSRLRAPGARVIAHT
jgi:hypothetical protein